MIYKYALDVTDSIDSSLEMPAAAKFVHSAVTDDGKVIYLWFEVYLVEPKVIRRFSVFPTGWQTTGRHLTTVSTADLHLVWHVYEQED